MSEIEDPPVVDGEVIPFPARPDAEPEKFDTSYEVALDDEPGGQLEAVHDGEAVARLPLEGKRHAVIPAPLKSLKAARTEAARLGDVAWYNGTFHALRSPWYLVKMLAWALWGIKVLTGDLMAWLFVAEHAPLRSHAVISNDSREYRSLGSHARQERKERRAIVAIAAVALCVVLGLFLRYAPYKGPIAIAAAVVAVLLLARAGRPADRTIITPSMITPAYRLINADVVLRAYYAARLGEPADPVDPTKPAKAKSRKPSQEITFGSRMERDGEGSRVVVNLPYGRTLSEAMDAREKLSSGLDVAMSQVFIHRYPASNRSHVLWVADRDPLAVPVGRTPLLGCKPTDIWKPAPLGLDERGQVVKLLLMWQSVLVGALPRQGKTFAARLLGLYAALDPYTKLHVFDPSGKPDWRKFALVADSCAFGLTPTKEGLPPEILLETLKFISADVQDRYNRLSELPTSVCPEGKLTREIARDPRLNMPVRVLLLDEFQEYFDLGPISKEISSLLVFLSKVAPGAGVIVIDATQKPSGIGTGEVAKSFTSARDNHGVRFSLRTSSYSVSEAVLGQGAYGEGLDSSTLLPEYKGVGILRGASDASPTVRTYLADGDDAEKILKAARALRERAGTLSGYAAGQETERDDRNVLADVLQVFGSDTQLHWGMLASRLEGQIRDRWADASPDAVSQQCRDLGVRSADVRWPPGRQGSVRKGCYRRDVEEAAARSTAGQKP
jgi:hypothetical protein